jgi:protein-L-isoaspartate(D-aspartate) O-methyltransferase
MTTRALLLLACVLTTCAVADSSDEVRRAAMVVEIERDVRETRDYTGIARLDAEVVRAIGTVPRHEFVPAGLRARAYENTPLPIGEGQTISQPFIVALMTQLAAVGPGSRVLEVGTGSGYQAAVLAELGAEVFTIEIVEPLGRRAANVLDRLGYHRVNVRIGDGYAGWPEAAPFDAIVVTAAPEDIPAPLTEQLRPGGRLVVPVGGQNRGQALRLVTKDHSGRLGTRDVLPVMFVPFTRSVP